MVKRFLSLLMCPLLLGLCGCGGAVGLETVTSTTEPATVNRLEEPVFDYIAYSRIDKGGDMLRNKINSIGNRNPLYDDYLDFLKKLLKWEDICEGLKSGMFFFTKVPNGYKIYQWAYRVDRKGDYIRVFDGLYDSIPSSLEEIVNGPHSYILAFRITTAYRRGLSEFLGNFAVPIEYPFPEYQLGFFFRSIDQQLLSIQVMNSDQRQHMNKIYAAKKITDLPEEFQKITLINSFRDFSLILYMFDIGFDLQHIERFYVGGGLEWDAILKKYIDILASFE